MSAPLTCGTDPTPCTLANISFVVGSCSQAYTLTPVDGMPGVFYTTLVGQACPSPYSDGSCTENPQPECEGSFPTYTNSGDISGLECLGDHWVIYAAFDQWYCTWSEMSGQCVAVSNIIPFSGIMYESCPSGLTESGVTISIS